MEFDVLVKELQKKEKAMQMLTEQRDSLDVNLNLIQEEAKSLQRTIEILTRDKAEMEEVKTEAEYYCLLFSSVFAPKNRVMAAAAPNRFVDVLCDEGWPERKGGKGSKKFLK